MIAGLDLPLVWAAILAIAVLMYVLLDGFDLGVGILFPFAASPAERDVMMNSVAPVWDGNETWLVLGGGGLFAAFPLAYGALLPALYLPIVLMLLALIFRGVAFEFRLHGQRRGKAFWTAAFAGGSTVATFAQGLVLGGFIQGVRLKGATFAGGPLDWFSAYSLLTGLGLVAGYALLGAAWLVWRTEGELHERARRWAWRALFATTLLLAAVSFGTLFLRPEVAARWGVARERLDLAQLAAHLPIPLIGLAGVLTAAVGLMRRSHGAPFAGAALIFFSGYLGLAASFFPYVVPYSLDFRTAANADNALRLLLGGAVILLPAIVGYSLWVYWIFRGKVRIDEGYH